VTRHWRRVLACQWSRNRYQASAVKKIAGMSRRPSRDSTKASPSRQTSSDATMAKKRSRRSRSAIRYIRPQSRLPVSTAVIRQPQVLKPRIAIDGVISSLTRGGSGSK
jgi:hypothetical protein